MKGRGEAESPFAFGIAPTTTPVAFAGRPVGRIKITIWKKKSFVCAARFCGAGRGLGAFPPPPPPPTSPGRAVLTINYLFISTKCPRGLALLEQ